MHFISAYHDTRVTFNVLDYIFCLFQSISVKKDDNVLHLCLEYKMKPFTGSENSEFNGLKRDNLLKAT